MKIITVIKLYDNMDYAINYINSIKHKLNSKLTISIIKSDSNKLIKLTIIYHEI